MWNIEYSYVIYIHNHLTCCYKHLTFTRHPSLCFDLFVTPYSFSLSLSTPPIPFSLPPIPCPSTCTIPSSHDYVAIVDRPQVLIIKASPDTPPYGVRSPVRLIPQIWDRKEGLGMGMDKKMVSGVFIGVFWWAHMFTVLAACLSKQCDVYTNNSQTICLWFLNMRQSTEFFLKTSARNLGNLSCILWMHENVSFLYNKAKATSEESKVMC